MSETISALALYPRRSLSYGVCRQIKPALDQNSIAPEECSKLQRLMDPQERVSLVKQYWRSPLSIPPHSDLKRCGLGDDDASLLRTCFEIAQPDVSLIQKM